MKNCPLCKKDYNDVTQTCPINHCPNCGSLKIKKHWYRKIIKENDKLYFLFYILFFGGVFGGFVIILLFNQSDLVQSIISVIIVSVILYSCYYFLTGNNYYCRDCFNKKFSPVFNIKLKKTKKYDDELDDSDVVEYETTDEITKKLDNLATSQTKHYKKNLVFAIIGILLTVIGIMIIISPDELSNIFNH